MAAVLCPPKGSCQSYLPGTVAMPNPATPHGGYGAERLSSVHLTPRDGAQLSTGQQEGGGGKVQKLTVCPSWTHPL